MLKIGLIGAGSIGSGVHNHSYAALRRSHDIAVTAIADVRKQEREEAAKLWPEAKLYSSGRELIENEALDAVDICLPTYLHAEHAIAAMEKGRDVFVEKPVCLTMAEAEALLETQKRTGVRVMVGQVLRFFPEYRFIKELQTSGKYGKLTSLVMQRLNGHSESFGWEGWFHDGTKSGAVIVDLHIHDADFARWVLGEPNGFSLRVRKDERGFCEHVFSLLDYGETLVSAEAVWDYRNGFPFTAAFRAGFEKATVVFDSTQSPTLKVFPGDGKELIPDLPQHEDEEIRKLTGYYDELRYFAGQCIAGKPIEQCTLEEGVKTVKLVLSEYHKANGSYPRG